MKDLRASLRYIFDRLVTKFLDVLMNSVSAPMPAPTEQELRAVERFRSRLMQMGSADVAALWKSWLEQFRTSITRSDPRTFLRLPIIRKTMFATNSPYLFGEFKALRASTDWSTVWKPATREAAFGHPTPYFKDRGTSGNMIHQAFQLFRLRAKCSLQFSELTHVLEFGGGYGAMCRLVHSLGFKGRYIIYDVPEISCLQEFYLEGIGLARNDSEELKAGVSLVSDPTDAARLFRAGNGKPSRLMIALWSLSESPVERRKDFVEQIHQVDYCLVAFQKKFEGIDNYAYFRAVQSAGTNKSWTMEEISHQPGHYLLIGCSARATAFAPK
ncbi:MAG: hypothetical protein HY961_11435 [Ignavibacteriae bacterium]|nr:hypothetical protein [Ignavibacteriota bacterium]